MICFGKENSLEKCDYDCFLSKRPIKNSKNITNCCSIKSKNSNNIALDFKKEQKTEKNKLNFDELILSQDFIEGNWSLNYHVKILIEEEKIIYEKINLISAKYNINEENGKITLLVLYYIYNKKSEKIIELQFIINKAKAYIKKIYNLEYEEISKEIN